MKTYFTVTRKSLAAVFLLLLTVIIVSGQFYAAANPRKTARTNAQRVSYIKSLGLIPDENAMESKTVTLPSEFSAVYKNYNELQKQAGYDLTAYKGVKVTVYTYPVGKIRKDCNDDYYINLMVYRGRIIGGDISSRNIYGEMLPLKIISRSENG
ncbi:MAG: DUF4830 domain-containing protein [Clostridia bacterium]|nr:DUF4830 domain-containing protein [Clostridia bacterium]